ncbi:MAG: hypothetical protein WBK95_04675 [Sulfurimonas sp.]|nr:hypothetical protein [Sulfurimonas sp.]MDD3059870.1 hypothetical protein [Sulfurimonas sp.]MDD5203148.1 hypothetical protein [Sulfurimonas sp.]
MAGFKALKGQEHRSTLLTIPILTGALLRNVLGFAGAVVMVALMGISLVKTRWRTTWGVQAGGRI